MKYAFNGSIIGKLTAELQEYDYAFIIKDNKKEIFSINNKGEINLRGKIVATDKDLADKIAALFLNQTKND